jgi:hypothetical protein
LGNIFAGVTGRLGFGLAASTVEYREVVKKINRPYRVSHHVQEVPMENKRTGPAESTRDANTAVPHDEIARLAYALWEARGGGDGLAEQDWLEAERRLQETQVSALLARQTKSQAA